MWALTPPVRSVFLCLRRMAWPNLRGGAFYLAFHLNPAATSPPLIFKQDKRLGFRLD